MTAFTRTTNQKKAVQGRTDMLCSSIASTGGTTLPNHGRTRRERCREARSMNTPILMRPERGKPTSIVPVEASSDSADYDAIYMVEDIIGEKIVKGQKFYKVRWQGFPPDSDSWEPEDNLSNVLEAINVYQNRLQSSQPKGERAKDVSSTVANSPASVPTPPSTPNHSISNGMKRLRGASAERSLTEQPSKRKLCVKSRATGRYEYVPKNQLVAAKTKYFDDIRDGKIDLSSNDLYSRVKTRRRLNETAAAMSSSDPQLALSGGTLDDSDQAADPLSEQLTDCCPFKREPNSPVSDFFNAGDSLSGFQSTVDSMELEQLKANMTDQLDYMAESISDSVTRCDSVSDLKSRAEDVPITEPILTNDQGTQCSREFSSVLVQSECSNVFRPEMFDVALSPFLLDCKSPSIDGHEDNTSFDAKVDISEDHQSQSAVSSVTDETCSSESTHCGPTVAGLRELVQSYIGLVTYTQQIALQAQLPTTDLGIGATNNGSERNQITQLDELPRLEPYSHVARVLTRQDLMDAISNQRWSLLANLNTLKSPLSTGLCQPVVLLEDVLQQTPTHSEQLNDYDSVLKNPDNELLIASVAKVSGRPVILERLLTHGLDANTRVTNEATLLTEPLITLAVRLRHIHVVQVLLDAGAQPDHLEPGPRGRTALGMALIQGDVEMATVLLLAGANFYQVETDTTGLSLVARLLRAHASIQTSASGKPPLCSVAAAERHDQLRSAHTVLHPSAPLPIPPPGVVISTVPKPVLVGAVVNSNMAAGCSTSKVSTGMSDVDHPLPSVESLRQLHDLIAVHHARLSVRVNQLVRGWLMRAGLVQVALVSPCQWINTRTRSTTVQFIWPLSSHLVGSKPVSSVTVPIVLLVHGRVSPPACYETWLDDDGPCLVKQVCLDQVTMQKSLSRVPFVTTLFPLSQDVDASGRPESHKHEVQVDFVEPESPPRARSTCVAVMIIAVAPSSAASEELESSRAPMVTFLPSLTHRSPITPRAASIHSPTFANRRLSS